MNIRWYFDFVSPFAAMQWPAVRDLAARHPVELRPILLGALFDHVGVLGPAEIPAKRTFTYQFALWRSRRQGRPLRFPPAHPFHPVAALRLCIAAGCTPEAVEAIFDWIWNRGNAGDTAEALASVAESLGLDDVEAAVARPDVKQRLRDNFELACDEQVFGVPTLSVDGRLFWGEDAHAFAMTCVEQPDVFDDCEMQRLAQLPEGVQRRR